MSRIVILGIDGMPYSLICDLAHRGIMKNVKLLFDEGNVVAMNSTVPDISNVAWTSLFTGLDPSWHGIYGFMDVKPGTYDLYFPRSQDRRVPALWEMVPGKSSIVVNVPGTYPATKMAGIMVSGFVSPDYSKSVYPPGYIAVMKEHKYQLDIELSRAAEDHDYLFAALFDTLEKRRNLLLRLADREKWHLLIAIITGTDRLHHFLYPAISDASHTRHQQVMEYYVKVDEFAADLRNECGDKDIFCMVSDHGFAKAEGRLALNSLLKSGGYLQFDTDKPKGLGDISSSARAFALEPTRIYVHRADRYPAGSVAPDKADPVVDELCDFLSDMEWRDKPAFAEIFRKQEIYSGPCREMAPDIVVVPSPGLAVSCEPDSNEIFFPPTLPGCHNRYDAFFYSSSPYLDFKQRELNQSGDPITAWEVGERLRSVYLNIT